MARNAGKFGPLWFHFTARNDHCYLPTRRIKLSNFDWFNENSIIFTSKMIRLMIIVDKYFILFFRLFSIFFIKPLQVGSWSYTVVAIKISNSSCFGGLKMIYSCDSLEQLEKLIFMVWTKYDLLCVEKSPYKHRVVLSNLQLGATHPSFTHSESYRVIAQHIYVPRLFLHRTCRGDAAEKLIRKSSSIDDLFTNDEWRM